MEEKEINLKLKDCKTAEELKTFAKEIGYELTDEEADAYLKQFNTSGELADDELDNVTGGCTKWRNGKAYSGTPPHYLIVTIGNSCRLFTPKHLAVKVHTCPYCGNSLPRPFKPTYCIARKYYEDPLNP